MRVCIINEFFYPDSTGGTGNTLSDLARSLADNHDDLEIDVITSTNLYRKSDTQLPLTEDWKGIKIFRISTPHPNGLSMPGRLSANLQFTFKAFLKLRQMHSYDLVLVATAPPMVAFAASVYKVLTKTPFVYIIYDLEPDRSVTLHVLGKGHPFVSAFRLCQRVWLNSADRIVALGEFMRNYVVKAYVLPKSKVEVIHIGSNEADIIPGNRLSTFRSKHNINGFVVLYTGNFGRYHNFDTILDAAKILSQTNPDIRFVLVGDGAQKLHISQRIAGEKIDNVQLFDFVPMEEYSDLLATADVSLVTLEAGMEVLCLPSKFYKILASERPVIGLVSPESDVAYVIEQARCGRQVDQGDSKKLADILTWLVDHPIDCVQMGANARKVFLNHFGTNAIAAQYYKTFLAACGVNSSEETPHELQTTGKVVQQRPDTDQFDGSKRPKGDPVAVDQP